MFLTAEQANTMANAANHDPLVSGFFSLVAREATSGNKTAKYFTDGKHFQSYTLDWLRYTLGYEISWNSACLWYEVSWEEV